MDKMDWSKLMSTKRIRKESLSDGKEHPSEVRSPFVKDFDKIIYSSAFRRLKDKTQENERVKSSLFTAQEAIVEDKRETA